LNTTRLTVWLFFIPLAALSQATPKSVFVSDKSNVPAEQISKLLPKACPNVRIVADAAKADFTLDATNQTTHPGLGIERVRTFDLMFHDRAGIIVRGASDSSLKDAIKDLCQAVLNPVLLEVVDTNNLTQSVDVRGSSGGGGVPGAVVNGLTGRRTHTDAMSVYVIVNGEHALLDCYERRTGCATIAPGKYYGELKGDGIWIDYEMPLTHKPMRNHYKLAGSW
jgi:hypothetical protein